MIGDPYEDRPASHAMHHAYDEGPPCHCGDDAPAGGMAWFAFALALAALALVLSVVLR